MEQKIPAVQCRGSFSRLPSPGRSEELFVPSLLPGQMVLGSHSRLWGQTCSNFNYSCNESIRRHSLLNTVLAGGLLEISVTVHAPMAAQAESSNMELQDSRRGVPEANEHLIFPPRQLGLMEDPLSGCEGGFMHVGKKRHFPNCGSKLWIVLTGVVRWTREQGIFLAFSIRYYLSFILQ